MVNLYQRILEDLVEELAPHRQGPDPKKQRCIALAITKMEEAVSWLEKADLAEALQRWKSHSDTDSASCPNCSCSTCTATNESCPNCSCPNCTK